MSQHPQQTVVIAGGSGFLGLNLARHLAKSSRRVVILSRRPPSQTGPWEHHPWDGRTLGDWTHSLASASAVVNLAGRSVDCIKTPERCDEILRSRVESTRVLGQAIAQLSSPPPVWVQMSTAHIYGDPPQAICDESSAFGYGLAPTVGRAWEAEHQRWLPTGVRSVVLRTSFVLGRHGGAMLRLTKLARWGLGGAISHGRQGMSWIHEHDMNRIFERAIDHATMSGAYIATAPNPVPNAEFMRELRQAVGQPFGPPTPTPLIRLGAPLLLRTDPELALYGRYCVPTRLISENFYFTFTTLKPALIDIYEK